MQRHALVLFSVWLSSLGVAQGQTTQHGESKNLSGVGNLYQPYRVTGTTGQNGSGVAWFADVSNTNQTLNYIYDLSNLATEGSGLTLAPVDDAARAHLKIPKGQGLLATSVSPQGAAAQAGVCQNDILLAIGDTPLAKPEDLDKELKEARETPLALVLLHQGEKKTIRVQPHIKVFFGPVQPDPPEYWIGVSVSPVDPALRSQLKLPDDQGLIATQIIENAPASRAGFKVNDILLTMAGKPLKAQDTLVDLVQKYGGKSMAVELLREGQRQTIEVTPERRKGPVFTRQRLVCYAQLTMSCIPAWCTRLTPSIWRRLKHKNMPNLRPSVSRAWPPRSRNCARPWKSSARP